MPVNFEEIFQEDLRTNMKTFQFKRIDLLAILSIICKIYPNWINRELFGGLFWRKFVVWACFQTYVSCVAVNKLFQTKLFFSLFNASLNDFFWSSSRETLRFERNKIPALSSFLPQVQGRRSHGHWVRTNLETHIYNLGPSLLLLFQDSNILYFLFSFWAGKSLRP